MQATSVVDWRKRSTRTVSLLRPVNADLFQCNARMGHDCLVAFPLLTTHFPLSLVGIRSENRELTALGARL